MWGVGFSAPEKETSTNRSFMTQPLRPLLLTDMSLSRKQSELRIASACPISSSPEGQMTDNSHFSSRNCLAREKKCRIAWELFRSTGCSYTNSSRVEPNYWMTDCVTPLLDLRGSLPAKSSHLLRSPTGRKRAEDRFRTLVIWTPVTIRNIIYKWIGTGILRPDHFLRHNNGKTDLMLLDLIGTFCDIMWIHT